MHSILRTNITAVSYKLFGCELPKDGDQPKYVPARKGEIYRMFQEE